MININSFGLKQLKKYKAIIVVGYVFLLLICKGFYVSAFPVFPMRRAPHPIYAPQEVLIEFASWATTAEIQKILLPFGVKEMKKLCKWSPLFRVKFSIPLEVEIVVASLNTFPLVKHAEPNFYVEAEFIPNDPIYIYQWHMGLINMELAWDIHNGAGAIVAVLDTGVAYRDALPYALAPDLAGTVFLPGWDFVNGDAFPDDDHGHGTHIVGTIAQTTNNLYGCAGVAYGCSIMPVKVLDENSNGLLSDVVAGFYFAVDNGAHIINTSFGTVTPSLILQDAVTYASVSGLTIVCSAGNAASSAAHYPSSYPECISVSAVKLDKTIAFYSNYGADIDLCAPGGSLAYDLNLDGKPDGIVQQTHDGIDFTLFNFYIYQGTSCAAAHVAGVAALIIGASGGTLGPDQVRSIMETTAEDIGTVGWDEYYGWGLVNAYASVSSLPLVAVVASASTFLPVPSPIPNNPSIRPVNKNSFPFQSVAPIMSLWPTNPINYLSPYAWIFHWQSIIPMQQSLFYPLNYNYHPSPNPFFNVRNQPNYGYPTPYFIHNRVGIGYYGINPLI